MARGMQYKRSQCHDNHVPHYFLAHNFNHLLIVGAVYSYSLLMFQEFLLEMYSAALHFSLIIWNTQLFFPPFCMKRKKRTFLLHGCSISKWSFSSADCCLNFSFQFRSISQAKHHERAINSKVYGIWLRYIKMNHREILFSSKFTNRK